MAEMGSQAVELVMDEDHNSAQALLENQPELSALLADRGLDMPSLGSTLFWRYNLASQDEAVRKQGIEVIRQGCRVAAAYGAGVFLVVAGQQETGVEYARSWKTAVSSIRQAADYAADLGVTIGVENVRTNFLCSPGEYAQFIDAVDHPAVRAYLDFGNGSSFGFQIGPPENWITAVKERIAMVHAKDYDHGLDSYVCCGQGSLNWDNIFSALHDVGYDGYLLVETPPKGGKSEPTTAAGLHAAETSLRWLKEFV